MDISIGTFLKRQNLYGMLDYIKCGFFLFMGIIHLFLYFSFRANSENFFFGLYALIVAVFFYLNNFVVMPLDFHQLNFYKNIIDETKFQLTNFHHHNSITKLPRKRKEEKMKTIFFFKFYFIDCYMRYITFSVVAGRSADD